MSGTLGFAVVAGLVPLLGLGDSVFKLRFIWGVQLPLDVLLGWFCLRAARVPGVDRIVRSYMLTIAGTSIVFLIGDGYQFVRSIGWPVVEEINGGVVPTVMYVVGLLLVIGRMLSHSSPGGSRGERLRFHLDAVTVLLGGGVLAWCFSLNPRSVTGLELISTLVAASVLLLAAFAAVKMVLSGTAPMTKGGSIPMILAAGLLALTTALPILDDDGVVHPVLMALRILAAALFAVGPRVQELQTRVNPDFRRERQRRPYNLLPYLAVAATFVTFLVVMPSDLDYRAWGGVAGVVAVTAVVVGRQLLAFVDNFDLINRLDATLLELRGHQALLHEQATHDGLTRLVNRNAFGEAVAAELADPEALARGLAVLLIDLDDFKTVNDTLGHGVGDGLLTTVADRLRNAVRVKDLVCRLGGDEFAVLLRGVSAPEAAAMATRILADLVQPARVDGHMLAVKASIGVAPAAPGDDPEGLLRNADIAMYAAKDAGKGGIQQYAPDMGARIIRTAELGTRLREAVGTPEFSLVYQPVVEMVTGTVIGAEALIRWQPPGRPEIPPADFIPTAESTGEIVRLGRWILREACRQLAAWRRDHPDARDLTMAVNVAGRQLQAPGFVDEVADLLAEYDIPPDRLVIEITETAMLDEPVVLAALHGLRGLGLDLALDDFGTAASSLGLLLTCPMSALKLDRSFVERLGIDSRPTAVATAVSQIARALDLSTVAEGVESPEQAEMLRELGYSRAQGFLYSPPLEPGEFAAGWRVSSTVS